MNETTIEASGDGAFDRVRRMLEAADIDESSIVSLSLTIRHEDDGDDDAADIEMRSDAEAGAGDEPGARPDEGEEKSSSPEVEHGPKEPDPNRAGNRGGGGTGIYEGDFPRSLFEGEAVTPDSNRGRVLRRMAEDPDEWFNRRELADEFDDLNRKHVGDVMNASMRKYGWTKRRKEQPQPDMRGVQYEYQITEAGRGAVEEGLRRAKSYSRKQREEQEQEMADDA